MHLLTLILTAFVCCFSFGTSAPSVDEKQAVVEKGVLKFTLDLIGKLTHGSPPEQNIIISAFNIYAALALLHLGSEEKTKEELTKFLGFDENVAKSSEYHRSLSKLYRKVLMKENAANTNISMGAGIFIQNGHTIKSTYAEQIKRYDGIKVQNIDFTQATNATDYINEWVSKRTDGHIPKILSQPVKPETLLILATTLYFNAQWQLPFKGTNNNTFVSELGDIKVPFLSDENRIVPYYKNEELGFSAISLAFENAKFRYYVLLPDQSSDVHKLTEALHVDVFQKLIENSEKNYVNVHLEIPKLHFTFDKELKAVLEDMGLKSLFTEPNLQNLLEEKIAVSQVKHAATIDLNEYGIEATAATVVQLLGSALKPPSPAPTIKFIANRPYMFIIHDIEDGVTLFSGIVHKPDLS